MEHLTIAQVIDGATKQLSLYGYAETGIRHYTRVWERFRDYADNNNLEYLTEELILAFIESDCRFLSHVGKNTPAQREKLKILNKLHEYKLYGMISSKRYTNRRVYTYKSGLGNSVETYIKSREGNISRQRMSSIRLYLERFCSFLSSKGIKCEDELSIHEIHSFFESCGIYTKSTVFCTASVLRGYLSFLYENKLTTMNLSLHVPSITYRKDAEIPTTYTATEIQQLLDNIDHNNPRGKRNYAMVLMAARLGMRSSDICGLEFSSIDWENNRLEFTQTKTGRHASYPLLEDVGLAIIDYLKNGRKPHSTDPHVFLRESPPYTRLSNGALYGIVDDYIKIARIHVPPGKKHGPHALRHSLSSRLLENDVPLPMISAILAHKSTETTKVYLKIAEKQLLECALEVPAMEVQNG
ncbi:site-specific integrase [Enterococcus larvae]|uniref:site-specific integrase n=1 Tax=Enterococcus larvae TaxID=2794352 RepID=UPI003F3508BD